MSLKRKASFSAMPSSSSPAPGEWDMVDSSRHLHSRTRKRFRDDRPNEEAIYEKTLRWIFSAQRQQEQEQQSSIPIDTNDELMDAEPALPTETVDPRQQTLLRFFPPRGQASVSFRPSREALAPRANETALDKDGLLRQQAFMTSAGSASGSETASSGCNQMDVDMDMDTDQSSDGSNAGSNMGVVGWM